MKTTTHLKPILTFILLISVFLSCKQKNKFHEYLESHQLGKTYHSIIVLTEKGCPPCNSGLANTVTQHKFDSTLIVVNALGTLIDLTEIKKNVLENTLVFDYKEEYYELGIKNSGVILLNKNLEIDSIFKIDAMQLTQQLEFVKSLSTIDKIKIQ